MRRCKVKARRVIPVKLKPTEGQKQKLDQMFAENKRLVRFLHEFCKRTGIIDYYKMHSLCYAFCRESFNLQSEIIQQQMKQVCSTFKGSYKSRHIPSIELEKFPIRLTYGRERLFYLDFNGGLRVKLSLPNGNDFRKEVILIHDGELDEPLTDLMRHKVSDSLLFPNYTFLITLKKDVYIYYKPETAIGIDFGVRNLVTTVTSDRDILQISGEPILAAHKKGIMHRRMKQKLGSKKFTYNDKKVVKDYVYETANKVIAFTKQFEKPIIVLEHLKELKKRMSYSHIYSISPYMVLRQAIINKALWNSIPFKVVSAKYTSQTCPKCNYRNPKNRNRDKFKCLMCSYEDDADVVAGLNLAASLESICGWAAFLKLLNLRIREGRKERGSSSDFMV
jgi:IS605 OrfB family transposase